MVVALAETMEKGWPRLRRRLRGEDLLWQNGSFAGNRYLLVTWHGGAENLPWGRIAAITDRPRIPTLLPPGATCPPGCPVRAYEPEDFFARLTVKAAFQCLRQLPQAMRHATVGIVDPQGIAPWACGELAAVCNAVKVFTLRPERYRKQEEWLLEERGLPLLYAAKPAELGDCLLCVAPYPTGVIVIPAPVITTDRSGIQGNPAVNRLKLSLPQEVREAIPQGIVPERFLGMIFETGFRTPQLDLRVEECRIDGRRAALAELVKIALRERLDIGGCVDYNK